MKPELDNITCPSCGFIHDTNKPCPKFTPDSAPSARREPEQLWPEEPWAIDPLMIGTPWNIETADGRNSICLVSENSIGGKRNRAKHRTATAERIIACVNALRGVSDPAAMLEAVRNTLGSLARWLDAALYEPKRQDCDRHISEAKDELSAALALLPPIRISGDASDTPAEPGNHTT